MRPHRDDEPLSTPERPATTDEERGDAPDSDASVSELVTGLLGDARDLALAHLDGIRQEMRAEARNLASTARFTGVMLCVATIGVILAGFGAAHGINAAFDLPLWASFLIASGVFLLAALIIGLVVKTRRHAEDEDLVPQHELAKIKRDAQWLASRARHSVS
jgi:hypothetical protein